MSTEQEEYLADESPQGLTMATPTLFNKINCWLANIFASFLSLLSMPNRQSHYNIVPINPYQPLPYPPSKSKRSKSPQETAIVCPSSNSAGSQVSSRKFKDDLAAINNNLQGDQPAPINGYPIPIDTQHMLNGPPTPPATQQPNKTCNDPAPQPPNDTGGTCNGIHGRTAPRHNLRKNAGCPANACKACCLMLNTTVPCLKHNAMNSIDQRKLQTNQRKQQTTQQTQQADILIASAEDGNGNTMNHPTKQGDRSMGRQVYKNRLPLSYLGEFRALQLSDQAEERLHTANAERAKRSIALVVWGSSRDNPHDFWAGIVKADSWPQFCLSQSNDIKAMVEHQLGAEWNGGLQVWSEEHQLWLHTPMDILVTYPVNTRKLLVVFPRVDPLKCKDIVSQLASVSTGGKKERMNLTAFIQQHASESPQKEKGKGRMVDLLSSPPTQSLSPLANKQRASTSKISTGETSSSAVDIEKRGSQPNKRARSPSPIVLSDNETTVLTTPNGPVPTTPTGWPGKTVVTMSKMKSFFDLTMEPWNKTNKEAFKAVFGSRYNYVDSTVSTYQQWLKCVTSARLNPYVAIHGDQLVKHGPKHFKTEWKAADNHQADLYYYISDVLITVSNLLYIYQQMKPKKLLRPMSCPLLSYLILKSNIVWKSHLVLFGQKLDRIRMLSFTQSASKKKAPPPSTPTSERSPGVTDQTHVSESDEGTLGGVVKSAADRVWDRMSDPDTASATTSTNNGSPSVITTSTTLPTSSLGKEKS
ncbi:uncharacterized protein MELLADRAFT_104325 [Melampsora larici-populina 98AG31]|uniref:Uncharacterized protein n=1 Tax=Melampsora larici-populina (strain 98AG31 / pathotype 3-4-7) TaxID=747676 RepID=F4REB7_MELLP|nr:uncharacterized protein MELLADRAFT_104325 [Melampsora larici-populina 98AG31]EGG09060.1 hypothetical protein MELLADRAFT_104325 [Melampsora larici-populina 98AG31]